MSFFRFSERNQGYHSGFSVWIWARGEIVPLTPLTVSPLGRVPIIGRDNLPVLHWVDPDYPSMVFNRVVKLPRLLHRPWIQVRLTLCRVPLDTSFYSPRIQRTYHLMTILFHRLPTASYRPLSKYWGLGGYSQCKRIDFREGFRYNDLT